MKTEPCKVCGNRNPKYLFNGKDRLYYLPGEFEIYQCRSCRLIWIYPQLAEHDLVRYYPENYYSYEDSRRVMPRKSFAEKIRYYLQHPIQTLNCILFSKILDQNRDVSIKPGMRILDVGCGDGRYLIEKHDCGCFCYGNDISDAALQRLHRAMPAIETKCGRLWEVGYPEDFFDIINLSHVVEHVRDVDMLLREVRRIIQRGGRVRIQVPNFASFTAKLFGPCWIHLDVPRHAYVFSVENFKLLCNRSGFMIESWRTLENSFSVIGSLIYVFNTLFQKQYKLMRCEKVWNDEFLKCLLFPYVLIVNLFRAGDTMEFILQKSDR